RGHQVEQGHDIHADVVHACSPAVEVAAPAAGLAVLVSFFLNISSMRRVTMKPPNTFTAASATAMVPDTCPARPSVRPAASMAPTMMMAEIALVTAIRGVCSAGVTFQTTW